VKVPSAVIATVLAGFLAQPLAPASAFTLLDSAPTFQLAAKVVKKEETAVDKAAAEAQKATADAKKAVDKAAKDAKTTAKKVSSDAEKAVGSAQATSKKAADKATKDAKKTAKKVSAEAEKAVGSAQATAQATSKKVAKEASTASKKAAKTVAAVTSQVPSLSDPLERDNLACKAANPATPELQKTCASIAKKVEAKKAKELKASSKPEPPKAKQAAKK
jgi:hypothetical protein